MRLNDWWRVTPYDPGYVYTCLVCDRASVPGSAVSFCQLHNRRIYDAGLWSKVLDVETIEELHQVLGEEIINRPEEPTQ